MTNAEIKGPMQMNLVIGAIVLKVLSGIEVSCKYHSVILHFEPFKV